MDHRQIEIARPCRERWDEMTPGQTGRQCAQCEKQVHDLAVLTSKEIDRLLQQSDGKLCVRLTRRADGSLLTRPQPAPRSVGWIAAGMLASGGYASAQSAPSATAVVRGKVQHASAPNEQVVPRHVRFVRNGHEIASADADEQGRWNAKLPPGSYDVIFGGPLFGERVNDVELHAGEQEFSSNVPRFAFGHLGLDREAPDSVTLGEVTVTMTGMSFHYAARHPLAYLGMMRRRLLRAI